MLGELKKVFNDKNLEKWDFGSEFREIKEFGKLVGEELRLNQHTTSLKISFQFGVEVAKYISEGLKLNTSLSKLNLDSNSIGNEGAKYISEALKLNISLTELNLTSNKIGNEGANFISEALKLNTSLIKLNLDSNNIGDEGAKYISEGLKLNTSLIELDLHSNKIGKEGEKYIIEVLKSNFCLSKIHILNYFSINHSQKRILKEKIKNNENLELYFKKLKLNEKFIVQLNTVNLMRDLEKIILEKDYQNETEVQNLINFLQLKVNEWIKGGNNQILNNSLLKNSKYFKTIKFQKQYSDKTIKPILTIIYYQNIELFSNFIKEIKTRLETMKKFIIVSSEQEIIQNIIEKYIAEWKENDLHSEEINQIIELIRINLKILIKWRDEVGFQWEMIPDWKGHLDKLKKCRFRDLIIENEEKDLKIKKLTFEKSKNEELMKKNQELEQELQKYKNLFAVNSTMNGLLIEK